MGSTGDVTLRAGSRVVLTDGFSVASGGRLAAETDPSLDPENQPTDASQSYAFDRFGNLLEVTTSREGEADQTRTIGTVSSTNRLSVASYDVAGNVTEWAGREYAWDPFGMLWQTKPTNGNGVTFVYGPGDERFWTVDWTRGTDPSFWLETWTLRDLDGTPLRQYRTDGGNETGNWSLHRDYVWRGGSLLAAETPKGTRHFHLDHLGSPRLITDAAGTTLAEHLYFPFGEEATDPGQDAEVMKFTGHERDDLDAGGTTADLDYMHARYFSAHLGRFHSPDPLNGSVVSPQSWNRYAYVLGNPLKYVDPYGLAEIDTCATSGSDEEEVRCEGTIDVIGEDPGFDPLTGVAGLGSLRAGRALLNALDSGIGATRGFYQRRFEDMAVQGNNVAAFIDFVGLQLLIPQSGEQLGGEILMTAVPFGRLGRLAKLVARNGTEITGFTRHEINRAIGDGASRAGVKPQAVLDALKNPRRIVEGVDNLGRPFQVFHGANARVVMNPETGRIVSMNPLSGAGAL